MLDLCDMVLVMTVNPGFGGQAYIATMEPKIADVRRWIVDGGHDFDIEVDGGIGPATDRRGRRGRRQRPGRRIVVFRDPDGLGHAVAELRRSPRPPAVA